MRFKPFLGYMLFVTIRISLMCQKLDLIEKSQMYGHNAVQPVLSTTVLIDTTYSESHEGRNMCGFL